MEARRGDRSRNKTASGWRRARETVGRCAREKTSEAENRESGGIRALISVLGPSRGTKRGVLTREILIPCQRQEGCRSENYVPRGSPPSPASPCNPRVSIPPSLFPPCPVASTNVTTLGARGWEGVTNQRLAIVNSTCAVKQLINKRLFTSCARGVLARTQSERIFPPLDDECGADNAAGRWTTRGRSGLKLKNTYLCSEIVHRLVINSCPVCESSQGIHGSNRSMHVTCDCDWRRYIKRCNNEFIAIRKY